jgi:uncharacterized protein YbcI
MRFVIMVTTDTQADIEQTLKDFWESYAGVRPGRVSVVADQQAIAVWLEGVLTLAERQMSMTPAGREAVQRLWDRILEQARPRLRQVVAEAMGQDVILVGIYLDAPTGSILGFFRRPVCVNMESIDRKEGKRLG